MSYSKSFDDAEKYFETNKNLLYKLALKKFGVGSIDEQPELEQVVVWFDGFSVCYQNGDMNGSCKGEPAWDNPGADTVFSDFYKIAETDLDFMPLIAPDETHDSYWLREFVNYFCERYADENNIKSIIESYSE